MAQRNSSGAHDASPEGTKARSATVPDPPRRRTFAAEHRPARFLPRNCGGEVARGAPLASEFAQLTSRRSVLGGGPMQRGKVRRAEGDAVRSVWALRRRPVTVTLRRRQGCEEARRDVGAFIKVVDNRRRLRSAIGCKPPVEFEDDLRQARRRETNQPMPVSHA